MKHVTAFIALMALSASALAADVVATMVVSNGSNKVYTVSQTFHGVTDDQARALRASAAKTLDYASKRQNKESCTACIWSIEWSWSGEPNVITERHTFAGVNGILRQGARWMDDRVTASETNRQRGKGKPWG
jgi:hypothetical protein